MVFGKNILTILSLFFEIDPSCDTTTVICTVAGQKQSLFHQKKEKVGEIFTIRILFLILQIIYFLFPAPPLLKQIHIFLSVRSISTFHMYSITSDVAYSIDSGTGGKYIATPDTE